MSELSLEQVIEAINAKHPQMNAVPATEFSSDRVNAIWFKQEGAEIDGLRVHDEYHNGRYDLYDPTVLISFDNFLNSLGFYSEPYDAGTLLAYKL